jgi:hypothetical protein
MTSRWDTRAWCALAAVIAVAAVLRVVFYTGFFGSDEVTYAEYALKAARGEPLDSIYIGAIRLGMNYPMAAFAVLFGVSESALAAYSVLCSVAEVAVVFVLAKAMGGLRLAVLSALLLLLVPLHVHFAGRVMADAPLALFITSTMAAFYFGERTGRPVWYVLSGICAGAAFWVKQPTIIFLLVFLGWALICRRVRVKWMYAALSFAIVIALNFLETYRVSGNALLLLDSVRLSSERQLATVQATSPFFYLNYLFLDLRHTALVGWFALFGALVLRRGEPATGRLPLEDRYLLVWLVGLIAVFSVFVASMDPFRLVPKQTNYMTIFLAPMVILGARFLLALRSMLALRVMMSTYVVMCVVLAALEEQAVRSFVSNSPSTVAYAKAHQDRVFHVMTNAYRYNWWLRLTGRTGESTGNMTEFKDIETTSPGVRWVVIDPQTLGWGGSDPRSISVIPPCGVEEDRLVPRNSGSPAAWMTEQIVIAAGLLPERVSGRVERVLRPLHAPEEALVFRIPGGCSMATDHRQPADRE